MADKRLKIKGRSDGERFIALPYHMTDSTAFLSLSGKAVKVLLSIIRFYNGSNNGLISYSYKQAQECFGFNPNTVSKAFIELQEKGFIEQVKAGCYRGNASEWRLTFKRDDRKNISPSHEWKNWTSEKTEKGVKKCSGQLQKV